MRKRLRWIPAAVLGLAFVAALVALFLTIQAPEEPEWGGIKLSEWLRRPSGDQHAALKAMSPQAFPYMLAMMRARDVRWQFQLASLLARQKFVKIRLAPRASFRGRYEAAEGFALLGANAAPAVPGLRRLLCDRDTADNAAYALLHIPTDDARKAVEHALLADKDSAVRQAAATQIYRVGRDARKFAPTVLKGLQDTNCWVREYCARALGRMGAEPALAVPALIECLNDRSSDVSRAAADTLVEFGSEARPAVPVLLEVVRQNDPTRRAAALRALRKMDPDSARSFPVD